MSMPRSEQGGFQVPALGPNAKTAERVARELIATIITSGWQVGTIFASEAELIERYRVSRAVLREAIRVLESLGIAVMKRGVSGGLFVTAPNESSVATAAALYLEYCQVDRTHLLETRKLLEVSCVRNVARRASDESDLTLRLHGLIRAEEVAFPSGVHTVSHDFHLEIAALSLNPVTALFLRVLIQISSDYVEYGTDSIPEIAAAVHRAHQLIVDAILAGDEELAARRISRHLDGIGQRLR